MKIAFSALFLLLLFAFSAQHLTVAAEDVFDTDGNPVVPGGKYSIRQAEKDRSHGIEVDQVWDGTCSTTVIIGPEPKQVSIAGGKRYPVVIGPTDDIVTVPGWFEIAKSDDSANEYYINFKFGGKDDYPLMISSYEHDKDFYRLVFAPHKGYKHFKVVFKPASPPPPTPSPPPPTPSPPTPPSTFAPHIRKVVR